MPQPLDTMPQVTADDVINFLNSLEDSEEDSQTLEELDFSD